MKKVLRALALGLPLTLALGCPPEPQDPRQVDVDEGPAERTGRVLDEAAEEIGEEIGEGMEEAGEELREAGRRTRDRYDEPDGVPADVD